MSIVYPGLCVLRFKYLAALTRRTVVTATGTGPTHHCLQQVTGFILPSLYILLLLMKTNGRNEPITMQQKVDYTRQAIAKYSVE